jgi:predicted kinase
MTKRTYEALLESARTALAAGRNVIVDATFANRRWRDRFQALARPFAVVYIDMDDTVIRKRLQTRLDNPNEVSDAGFTEYLEVKARFEAPDELGRNERLAYRGETTVGELSLALLERLIRQA